MSEEGRIGFVSRNERSLSRVPCSSKKSNSRFCEAPFYRRQDNYAVAEGAGYQGRDWNGGA